MSFTCHREKCGSLNVRADTFKVWICLVVHLVNPDWSLQTLFENWNSLFCKVLFLLASKFNLWPYLSQAPLMHESSQTTHSFFQVSEVLRLSWDHCVSSFFSCSSALQVPLRSEALSCLLARVMHWPWGLQQNHYACFVCFAHWIFFPQVPWLSRPLFQ